MDEVKTLIEIIAKSLVDKPNSVVVDLKEGDRTTLLTLRADQSEIGKIIGKQGKNAAALRTIAASVGAKLKKRYHLDIVD